MSTSDNRKSRVCAPARASLGHNITALYALQLANYLIPLLTLPYLIRSLGAAHYGALAIACAVVYFLVLFVDAGFNTQATRELSRPGITHEQIREIFAATQWIKIAQVIIAFIALTLLVLMVPSMRDVKPLYFASFLMVIGSLTFPTWLFQGLEIMHYTTLFSVAGRLLAMIGIFAWVRTPDDLVIAATLQASATALSGALCWPMLRRRLGLTLWLPRRQLLSAIRYRLRNARQLACSEFLTNAIANSNVFILSLFAADALVGIFAALEKLARAAFGVFQPLLKALFPGISSRWQGRFDDASAYTTAWSMRILLLALAGALSLAVLAPAMLEILFGPDFSAYAPQLRLLSLWLFLAVSAAAVGQFRLLARGWQSHYSLCLVAAGTLQFIASIYGAAVFGLYGIVVAMVCSEAMRLSLFACALHQPAVAVK